jgi:hypothetical protein
MGITNFLYNPGRKGKRQLINEFVIRQDILELILEDLKASNMLTPEQHYLLVGQRGTGKTTLLHRIRYAIEDESELNNWLIPIILTEEQYNISELANLWEAVGQLLEDYHGFTGLFGKMEKHLSSPRYDELCWETLENSLDEKGKKLVILIDNIGDLLKKLDELEVRRLRRILQTKPHVRMIAASPLYLDNIFDYKEPFFEFFKILRLEDLNSADTRTLLLKLAEINDEKPKIERIIRETPERIETLRVLTGGVPRTIALMFNIFIEYEYETSLKDLERILDVVTPLYKHRMDDLPTQQQKIVDAVAKAWDPIGVKALKEKLRLESKVISAQLRQLEKNQVVQKLETSTKNHEYILKERFFNIWYLMRYGRKDDKQRVVWLVRFLESWCTDEEIENRIAGFITRMKTKGLDENYIDFLGEVYTSMTKLSLHAKLLLRGNIPVRYARNLNFKENEINELVNENFSEGDYQGGIKWMSRLDLLNDANEVFILSAILGSIKEDNNNANLIVKALLENLRSNLERSGQIKYQIEHSKDVNITPDVIEHLKYEVQEMQLCDQVICIVGITLCLFCVALSLEKKRFEDAINSLDNGLKMYGMFPSTKANNFTGIKGEVSFLLLGVRMLYLNNQFHSLKKLFTEGYLESEKVKIMYSEIFNPIYLAINSLDPEAEKVNLAPEKAGIVEEIREFIQKEG